MPRIGNRSTVEYIDNLDDDDALQDAYPARYGAITGKTFEDH